VKAGRNVSYLGRYTLASFLLKSGQEPAEAAETFKSLPDFDDALSLYQAEHIAECGDTPPSCENLKIWDYAPFQAASASIHPMSREDWR